MNYTEGVQIVQCRCNVLGKMQDELQGQRPELFESVQVQKVEQRSIVREVNDDAASIIREQVATQRRDVWMMKPSKEKDLHPERLYIYWVFVKLQSQLLLRLAQRHGEATHRFVVAEGRIGIMKLN